jgi:hypothetical protein
VANGPTGGAAYGTPRKAATPSEMLPRMGPAVVTTVGVGVVEEEVGGTGRQQQQLSSVMAQVRSSHWLRACDMASILSCGCEKVL